MIRVMVIVIVVVDVIISDLLSSTAVESNQHTPMKDRNGSIQYSDQY